MKFALLAVTACLTLPLAAQAQHALDLHARTVGELADMCGVSPREADADAKISYCHGFAQGVVDTEMSITGDKKPFCWPTPQPSRSAVLGSFVDWVRALPAHRSEGSVAGLMRFLAERYPCK